MEAQLLPMGGSALLVEVAGTDDALALRARVAPLVESRAGVWAAVDHFVVGACTLLVVVRDARRWSDVARACLEVAAELGEGVAVEVAGTDLRVGDAPVEVQVRYDGPDLEEVARLTGLSCDEVVRAHTGTTWRVGFGGFAPGFAYLVNGDPRLQVPRRGEPRARVPVGSVAVAGQFSGIYPQDSPGGWQLIGTTDAVLWDVDRDPPALLAPGGAVRFVEVADRRPFTPIAGPTAVVRSPEPDVPASGRGLEVVATGPLSLVEDLGRSGFADVGVGRSGAADLAAYLLGLRLVGHLSGHDDATEPAPASVEVTFGGLVVRARGDLLVALTGAPCAATVDGRPAPHAAPFALSDGQELSLGAPVVGLRTWLAVRGGIAVAPVLGSRSTDMLAGVGPRPLAAGDVLPVGPAPATFPVVEVAPEAARAGGEVVLDMVPGPRAGWCDLTGVEDGAWSVSSRSNRVGIRLQGMAVRRQPAYAACELPSEGLVTGAVQVPPGGEPVIFLADHPVTGGYPVVAVLTRIAAARAAQLRPGDRVRLRWCRSSADPSPDGRVRRRSRGG